MLNPKIIGAFLGLVVGLVAVLIGIWQAFVLILFILVGWLIGKIYMGELNPFAMYRNYKASRDEKKREEF